MSNYVQTTFFTPKDTLPTTNPAKTIFGAAYDVEFGNIAAAITSKYDNTTTAPSLLSLTVGTPTGGNLGAGSVNVQSLFVNNVAVLTSLTGAVTSITGTANQIAASASTGAVTLSLPQSVTIGASNSGVTNSLTIQNTSNTASSIARLVVSTGGASAGSPSVTYDIAGVVDWVVGVNVLTSNFSISQGVVVGTNDALRISAAGNVSIPAPSSGTALTVNGVAGAGTFASIVTAPNSAGLSNGLRVFAGANSTDILLALTNAAQTINYWLFTGDGGVFSSGNTTQGIGTINATGLFINAGQLFFGVPASTSTTAAVPDVGKCINASGTITVPNAVFSQGHAFSIYNNSGAAITISAGITTMRLAGTATTGSRTLAQRGIATIWFESGTECVVGGPGVT